MALKQTTDHITSATSFVFNLLQNVLYKIYYFNVLQWINQITLPEVTSYFWTFFPLKLKLLTYDVIKTWSLIIALQNNTVAQMCEVNLCVEIDRQSVGCIEAGYFSDKQLNDYKKNICRKSMCNTKWSNHVGCKYMCAHYLTIFFFEKVFA